MNDALFSLDLKSGVLAADLSKRRGTLGATGTPSFDWVSPYAPAPSPEDPLAHLKPQMEDHLRHVGRRDGPYATSEGRAAEMTFWTSIGEGGARWLIGQGGSLRRRWAIAEILSNMGVAAIGPALEALSGAPEDAMAGTLLLALTNMPPDAVQPCQDRVLTTIRNYLSHHDDAVRLQAVSATEVLPREQAVRLLKERLEEDRDQDVRDAIADALKSRR